MINIVIVCLLGRVYSEVGQKKKAEDCFVSCINATNIFVSSGAYYYC